MRYVLKDLTMHVTPKSEGILDLPDLSMVQFVFSLQIKTVLFISYGLVKAETPYYEIVGRLYSSDNPKETNENHIGKLYIYVDGYPGNVTYRTQCEELRWKADGSFDTIPVSEGVFRDDHNEPSGSHDAIIELDDAEKQRILENANAEVIRAAEYMQKGRLGDAENICLALLNDAWISQNSFLVAYIASEIVVIKVKRIGNTWPQPHTSEYSELRKYLKLMFDNYDDLTPEVQTDMIKQLDIPIDKLRESLTLMLQNKPLDGLGRGNDPTLIDHTKNLALVTIKNILVILAIVFLLVGIIGKSFIGYLLFAVCCFVLYKLIRKK